jgi:hypothetical protein
MFASRSRHIATAAAALSTRATRRNNGTIGFVGLGNMGGFMVSKGVKLHLLCAMLCYAMIYYATLRLE